MSHTRLPHRSRWLIALLVVGVGAYGAPVQLADSPLSGASAVAISPNIMFVLDDSGSMDWDYLPDWAGQTTDLSQRKNPGFNGVAYNPAVTYSPPKYFDAGGSPDTTTYPSQTSANTSGWTRVKNDGYGVQSNTTSDLNGNAYYFTTVAGEYCTNDYLKSCTASAAPTGSYLIAAPLRWCTNGTDAVAAIPTAGACQATQIDPHPAPPATATNTPFNYPRLPAPRAATLTLLSASNGSISSITVATKNILSAATTPTSLPAAVASDLESKINACSFLRTGSCDVVGYRAVASGTTVTISAPDATSAALTISMSGITVQQTAFARPATNLAPGENLLTVIHPDRTSYPKGSKRTDCAATSECSYAEEMTNYANWWAYYRTRMQAMKSATSRSFDPIGSNYRVGYMTINNNSGTDFQNIDAFTTSQKKAWYDKVFSAVPRANTPLRVALSQAGRLFAGQLNATSLNGVTVVDPVQHYCQDNATILSTDGYWNEGAGFQLNGTTPVGDQDGPDVVEFAPDQKVQRPQLDAGGPLWRQQTQQTLKTDTPTAIQHQQQTVQLQRLTGQRITRTFTQQQSFTLPLQQMDGQLQSSTSQLQCRLKNQSQIRTLTQPQEQTADLIREVLQQGKLTNQLQTRTLTQWQEMTSHLQRQVARIKTTTYQLQQKVTQVQQRTSGNGGTTWSGWTNVDSCSPVSSGTNQVRCQVLEQSGWNAASSCREMTGSVIVTHPGTDQEQTTYTTDSQCRYSEPQVSQTDGGSCTPVAKSPSSPYTVGTAVECETNWPGNWSDAASCTGSASEQCRYSPWPASWTNVASCTEVAQDNTAPVARLCRKTFSDWQASNSTCTPSASVECRYEGWTDRGAAASCTSQDIDAATFTVPLGTYCYYQHLVSTAVTSCTPGVVDNFLVSCSYSGYSNWNNVASCTPTDETPAGSGVFVGPARKCQMTYTPWTNTNGTCVPSATTDCQKVYSDTYTTDMATCHADPDAQYSYTSWTAWSNVDSCTAISQSNLGSGTPPSYASTATRCQTTWPAVWSNTPSCTPSNVRACRFVFNFGSNFVNTDSCTGQNLQYPIISNLPSGTTYSGDWIFCNTTWTDWSPTDSSCVASDQRQCDTQWANSWENTTSCQESVVQKCNPLVVQAWTTVDNCQASADGNGQTIQCRDIPPGPATTQAVAESNCTEQEPSSGNNYVRTTCTTNTSAWTQVDTCTEQAAADNNQFVQTKCQVQAQGQTPDTLADVAEYYWKTDLRDPSISPDLCTGGPIVGGGQTTYANVCTNDTLHPRQFMSTYTLGLGASGLMQYQENYDTAATGDFNSVKRGVTADPATGVCSWQSGGECNWPKPESNQQTNIDDLWHAAVNGRGRYFSASNAESLASGISAALSAVTVREGALAAVAVSNPNLVAGDSNALFQVSFKVGEWSGDVQKRTINGSTGQISETPVWSAQDKLETKVSSGTYQARTIYAFNPSGGTDGNPTDKLKVFTWSTLSDAQKAYFQKPNISTLSQLCAVGTICLDSGTQENVGGENLVNFLRGDRTNEGSLANLGAYYRQRNRLLGDIVDSEVLFVQGSPWNYADYKYALFKASNQSRTAMVYVGANDGMLHALNAQTGEESWAYVPTMVMPTLFRLSDKYYSADGKHQFSVDGTPVMGDICASDCATPSSGTAATVWKTILVGGLNNGGRGYYALDITNPAAPKALWEFTHDNLGYSYGNPVITKLKNGTWVVIVASGYNNISPGDGKGYLFILNANSGELIRAISTDVGDSTTPSGLARVAAWANFPDANNTAQRVYGGDLLGNVWRFDVNDDIAPDGYEAQRLATLIGPDGSPQPITAKPELGKVGNVAMVYVATGRLLGNNDLGTTQGQSLYAIKDNLTATDYGSPRPTDGTPTNFVRQTLTAGTCDDGNPYCTSGQKVVTSTKNAVDLGTKDGWYFDFPGTGERVTSDLRLQLGTLAFTSNTPSSNACVPAGISYAYAVDYRTGGYVEGTDGMIATNLGSYLGSAQSVVRLVDGTLRGLIQGDKPGLPNEVLEPVGPAGTGANRVSWRELVNE